MESIYMFVKTTLMVVIYVMVIFILGMPDLVGEYAARVSIAYDRTINSNLPIDYE